MPLLTEKPKRSWRDVRLLPHLALAAVLAVTAQMATGKLPVDGTPAPPYRLLVDKHFGRTIVLHDAQQVSADIYWAALDSSNGAYAATEAILATSLATEIAAQRALGTVTGNRTASNLSAHGSYANVDGANGYSGLKIVGPFYGINGLSIVSGGLCRDIFNYACSRNPNYAAVTYEIAPHTGEQFRVWGKFIRAPARLPTTGEDLRLAIAKGTVAKTAKYVSRYGTGDGTSYLNAAGLEITLGNANSVATDDAAVLVLCGDLVRDSDWGVGGSAAHLYTRANDANNRLQVISHPIDRARVIGLRYAESTSTIGTWTSIGSGTWALNLGASVSAPAYFQFCFKLVNGTLTPLTKVASQSACQALADSFCPEENFSGSDDRVTVHLADGSNPNETFVVSGALYPDIGNKKYFDAYGIDFIGNVWLGSGPGTMEEFAFYGCGFGYTTLSIFAADNADINEGTGAFTYHVSGFFANPNNRKWIGCYHRYGYTLVYDNNNGHGKVPTNTTIQDTYFYRCNGVAADNYGLNAFSSSDQHQATGQGADGWYCINNRSDECGNMSFVQYLQPTEFTTPTGGLELTDFYTLGVNYPTDCFSTDSDVTFTYGGVCRNVKIKYNYVTNPRIGGAYAAAGTQLFAVNGDNGQCLGLNGLYSGIEIAYNRAHVTGGGEGDHVLRAMLCIEDGDADTPHVHHNVVRADTATAFFAANTVTVTGPIAAGTYDPSFRFYDNDIQSSGFFLRVPNVANPAHHAHLYDRNTYRGSGKWEQASGTVHTTLPPWQGAAASGDVHDPNSTLVA